MDKPLGFIPVSNYGRDDYWLNIDNIALIRRMNDHELERVPNAATRIDMRNGDTVFAIEPVSRILELIRAAR